MNLETTMNDAMTHKVARADNKIMIAGHQNLFNQQEISPKLSELFLLIYNYYYL